MFSGMFLKKRQCGNSEERLRTEGRLLGMQ
jgi:hypothetical protein